MRRGNSQVTSINLEGRDLYELSGIMKELTSYPNLQRLSLRDNNLSKLGKEISILKKLKHLDITNNNFESLDDAIEGLISIPLLKELSFDLRSAEEEALLLQALPKLQKLNGTKIYNDNLSSHNSMRKRRVKKGHSSAIKSASSKKVQGSSSKREFLGAHSVNEFKIKNEDLENVAALYDCMKILMVKDDKVKSNKMTEQLESHIKQIMVDLGLTIKPSMHPSIKATHNLKARFALYEIVFAKLIEYSKNRDPEVSEVLEELHDSHSFIFKGMLDVIFDIEPKTDKLYANYRERNRKAYEETSNALESADKLYEENQKIIGDWEEEQREWEMQKTKLMQEISNLESENKRYLNMILKHSKDRAGEITSKISPIKSQNNEVYNRQDKENFSSRKEDPEQKTTVSSTNLRMLTKKQLKELITDIYASKLKCDQKYIESKLPRETMEQHMYTYLNTKYGLKSLIIEWATAIINGIKKYSSADNDIAVFGKILRNECDEEFRFVQSQVKTTVKELLKMLIKSRFPYKNKREVGQLLKSKVNGYLSEEEGREIARYMYSKEDSDVIIRTMKTQLTSGAHLTQDRRMTREERQNLIKDQDKKRIEYIKFQKIILDFQLKSHERFLMNFNQLFRNVDIDQNGIIDEQEFRSLVRMIDPRGELGLVIEEMLDILDPFANDIITFSSCVTLFSSKLIDFNDKKLSILHKLSLS